MTKVQVVKCCYENEFYIIRYKPGFFSSWKEVQIFSEKEGPILFQNEYAPACEFTSRSKANKAARKLFGSSAKFIYQEGV